MAQYIALTVSETDRDLVLKGEEISVSVSRERGTVSRITSLLPVPLDVLPPTEDGLVLVVTDKWTGKSAAFNRASGLETREEPEYASISATLRTDHPELGPLMEADVEYRMYADRFQALCTVRYLQNARGPFELTFGQKEPRADFWLSQGFPGVFGGLDVLSAEYLQKAEQKVSPLTQQVYQRFNDHPNDMTRVEDIKLVRFPYGIVEGPDRFMLYGKMDVNGYVYLAAGHDERNPCLLVTPYELIGGKSYTFDLTYKFFTQSDELHYAEVCLWYAQNCYSTNHLTKGLVAIPKDLKPRTLIGDGNEAGGPSMPVSEHPDYIEWAKKAHLGHFWDGWTEWDEIPTLEPEFLEMRGQTLTEDFVRREMQTRRELGWHSYSYRRQLFPFAAYRQDRPWKREWMLSTKPGMVFVCPEGPAPINNLPFSNGFGPEVDRKIRDELGITAGPPEKLSYIHADFCNDECREFYIDALKRWIDKYDCLDGFAFDMGWDIHTVPCMAHPDDGTHHGIVNLMAALYRHIEDNHPDQRVVMNMLQGSPSNLWCHGVMFEGGTGMTYEAVESVKIYRATMFVHHYVWQHKNVCGDNWLNELEYTLLSNLAMGVIIGMGDTMGFAEDPNLNNKTDLYALSAKLPSHPLVIESGAFIVDGCTRREVYRSVFADSTVCHAFLFNNTDAEKEIRAVIRGSYLQPYGWNGEVVPKTAQLFNSRGYLEGDGGFTVRQDGEDIVIRGILGPKQLVGITSD